MQRNVQDVELKKDNVNDRVLSTVKENRLHELYAESLKMSLSVR